jgi:hypothetical protein
MAGYAARAVGCAVWGGLSSESFSLCISLPRKKLLAVQPSVIILG